MFIDKHSDLAEKLKSGDIPLNELVKDPQTKCRFLNKKGKKDKYIIQIGFIITDRDKHILVISKKDKYHHIKKHTNSILVSFSPLPDRYEESFNVKEIYYNGVKSAENVEGINYGKEECQRIM